MPTIDTSGQHSTEAVALAVRQLKYIKVIQIRKDKVKLSFCKGHDPICKKNPTKTPYKNDQN